MISEPVSARRAEVATASDAAASSAADSLSASPTSHERLGDRLVAIVEVVLCSGFPTQLLLIYSFAAAGFRPFENGQMSLAYVSALSLADAALLLGLIFLLMNAKGEVPRHALLGARSPRREALLGALLIVPVFFLAVALLAVIRLLAPWMHNVTENPLEALLTSPGNAAVFAVVAVVAGGVREEIQRAFILRRFEQSLGGGWMGVLVFSLAFGAGHTIQGWDAAVTTAVLGATWGIIYLRRRSVLVPIVSHSGFNIAEIVRYTLSS